MVARNTCLILVKQGKGKMNALYKNVWNSLI